MKLPICFFLLLVLSGCCNCPSRELPPRVKSPTSRAEEKLGAEMMDRYLRQMIETRKRERERRP